VATLTPRRPEYGGSLDSEHLIGNKRGLPAQAFFLPAGGVGLIFRAMKIKPWWHVQRSRLFAMFKQHERAADELREALRLDPAYVRAACALGFLYGSLGRYSLAVEHFEVALKIEPDNAIALFDLGYVRHREGQHELAIAAFKDAVRLKPNIDRAWYGMGLALSALGRHEEAAQALEQAARLQPMNGYAWYELGMAYHTLNSRDKLDEVIAHLNRFDPKMTQHLVQATAKTSHQSVPDAPRAAPGAEDRRG
jgi:tetratricopeptide (TPR) repeat protein